jgi:hypothetical protein
MNPNVMQQFRHYRDFVPDDTAAALLVLSEAVADSAQIEPRRISQPGALLSLAEAAPLVGYEPEGLRKLVNEKQIKYIQNGKKGRIKFRREWLDEFNAANESGPKTVVKSPAQRKRPARSAPQRSFGCA